MFIVILVNCISIIEYNHDIIGCIDLFETCMINSPYLCLNCVFIYHVNNRINF